MDYFEPDYEMWEPTEADAIFLEASEKLTSAIKESVTTKIQRIIDDNKRLKNENDALRSERNQVAATASALEIEQKELKRKAARMPVKEFFGQHAAIMWKAGYHYENGEKCDKCDDRRYIKYVSPAGRKQEERCTCYKNEIVYEPEEMRLVELSRDKRDGVLRFWFKPYNDGDGYSSGKMIESVWSDEPFSEIDKYETYFNSPEECQLYCDWLNENKRS